MQDSPSQKLTLLFIIVVHLTIHRNAIAFSVRSCSRERLGINPHHRRCPPLRISEVRSCSLRETLCHYPDVGDCLVPQFQCASNSRCIPRRRVCNGFPDCSDGSDEWGCKASSDYPDTDTRHLESVETTFPYITTPNNILRGNQEKTTYSIRPEDDTSSPPTTSRMLPQTEFNTALSSSTSTMIPDFESNTALSSSTTTISSDSESNDAPSSTVTNAMFSHFEKNTRLQSSTITTMSTFPDSELNTALPLSSSTTKTMTADSKSNTALPLSSSTTKMMTPDSELNTALSLSSSTTKMMTPDSELNTALPLSSSTTTKRAHDSESNTTSTIPVTKRTIVLPLSPEETFPTSNAFPETSAMQKCPDNYCMHNAECTVVQGQYNCRCPSSFFGELCEIKLGTENVFYEYTVVIAISMTLAILCLAVISICIYRYKRLSWKFSDKTTRTLSQLTLTSNDVA